jgi:hypothetical protein
MKQIENVHERVLRSPDGDAGVAAATVGALIDGLAGVDDRLWPRDRWPAMYLHGGLRKGSEGGHGPIHYQLIEYRPGRLARFRFTGPAGLIGEHRYELEPADEQTVILRHVLSARTEGRMRWQWPLMIGPFHDALMEDSLDHAQAIATGTPYRPRRWPPNVRVPRWLLKGLM